VADSGATSPVGEGDTPPDVVAAAMTRVYADLAARRARGETPEFVVDELRRHFDAVVEAYDGALLELPPVEVDGVGRARLVTGVVATDSRLPGGSSIHRAVAKVVGRQVQGLAQQIRDFGEELGARVAEIAERQEAMRRFLLVAHLERLGRLEDRVALLERELEATRAASAPSTSRDDG
jgi:hypothetical protein